MAPKRRRDAVTKEIPKTYTFGRSQIDGTDVGSLEKNHMVGTARTSGQETVPQPRDNEVIIFRDLLYAGLRSPFTPPSSISCGTSTYTCTSLPPMQFFGYRCTCGYAAP
jgi:hypothetical protein